MSDGFRAPENRARIAAFVRSRRHAARLSQAGLAAAMTAAGDRTERDQVAKWETGLRTPHAGKLLLILEVTADLSHADDSPLGIKVRRLEAQLAQLRLRLKPPSRTA